MTRAEIEQHYKVVGGQIRSPGKFEAEPVFLPHFWDMGMEGFSDDEFYMGDTSVWAFKIDAKDVAEFPELRNYGLRSGRKIYLWESDQGFVNWSATRPR
jgi:hypothetical protein